MKIKDLMSFMLEGELGEKIAHLATELDRVQKENEELKARLEGQAEDVISLERTERVLEDQARLLDLVHEAFIVHDLTAGTICFWNPAAETLYGYSRDEAIGRVADELLDSHFPRSSEAIKDEVLRTGCWTGETVQRRKDGSRLIVLSDWALERDDQGRPRAIIEVNRDISDQKRATETVAELAAIVLNANDAISGANLELRVTTWNPAAERLYGYTAPEILGKPFQTLIPLHRLGDLAILEKVARGGTVPAFETERLRSDGAVIDVAVMLSPIRDDAGQIIGVSSMARDITERKRIERETHRTRMLLQRIVDHVPASVGFIDRELTYRWINPSFLTQLDIPREQVLDRTVREAFPEAADQLIPLIEGVYASGRPYHGEAFPFIHRCKGREVTTYWDFTYQPVYDAGHHLEGVLVLGVEVTERVEKAQFQQQMVDALKETDVLKDQFLSILSHELRTPINAITGFASILGDEVPGPLNEAQHGYTRRILEGSDVLLSMIEDLLDLTRIHAGRVDMTPRPMRLQDAAEQAVDQMSDMLGRHHCRVMVEVPDDLPEFVADERRVQQVLTSLLSNAAKFVESDRDGCTTWLRARREGERVRVEVEDQGVGIAEKDIPKLFQPFSQIDMSSTRRYGGFGIGLSIVKKIVEAHGGDVGVLSTPGQGSTFWFTLPLEAGNAKGVGPSSR